MTQIHGDSGSASVLRSAADRIRQTGEDGDPFWTALSDLLVESADQWSATFLLGLGSDVADFRIRHALAVAHAWNKELPA